MRSLPTDLGAIALWLTFLCAPVLAGEAKPDAKAKPKNARPHLTLNWSTESEVDNFGYFVMRSENEKGPFKAVNDKAIPGAGNSEVPRNYRYEDYDVKLGKAYWYYLESVSTSGVREKFSPVLKRQCCKQVEAKKPTETDGKKADPKSADPGAKTSS
jgi:hypothetical protein